MKKETILFSGIAVLIVCVSLVLLNLGMSHAQRETTVEKMESAGEVQQKADITQKPFQVLISGMHNYGKLKKNGLSDLNLLLTINPVTKTMLVTSTPRNTYITGLGKNGDEKEKLLHLGVYGVKNLVQGLEKLYDTKVDYYVQLNFSGFIRLVDAIGGVNVKSSEAFESDWGTSYQKGENSLDGKEALYFVRERHHLYMEDGTKQQKNHLAMFEALFEQVTTKSLFEMDVNALYQLWKDNVRTNLKMGEIMSLIQSHINDKKEWKVSFCLLEGEGMKGKVESYKKIKLYVLKPKKASLEKVKKEMAQVLGQTG